MRVHVFARAPVPGQCKTRLMPRLGARGAAWVQKRLTEQALHLACEAVGATQVTLWGAPDTAHGFFHRCRRHFGVRLARQPRGDLGRRMRVVLSREPGLLIGSDAFGLQLADFHRALAALVAVDHLLLPATDGGYVLLGSRCALPALAGVHWSSGRECGQTAQRLRRSGLLQVLGSPRADFDTPADWRRARRAGLLPALTR